MALEACGGLKQQAVLPWLQGEAEGPMGSGGRAALRVDIALYAAPWLGKGTEA